MKKQILVLTAFLSTALLLAGMLLFVLRGGESPALPDLALDGVWKVVAKGAQVSLPENEFIRFDEKNAENYRNSETPFASSGYALAAASDGVNYTLKLNDLSRSYTLRVLTDNYIRLHESKNVYMDLIRYANEDMSELHYEADMLNGKWNVAYRQTDQQNLQEQLVFSNGELRDYRNGSDVPTLTAAYTVTDKNRLTAAELNMEMLFFPMSDHMIFLVETNTGYVWELHKAE